MTDTTTYCQSLGDEVVSTFSSCKTCLVEECFWCKPKDGNNLSYYLLYCIYF